MEIIEHGKTYKIFTYTYCGCAFAVCEKDIYWSKSLQNTVVMCPECETEVEVKKWLL